MSGMQTGKKKTGKFYVIYPYLALLAALVLWRLEGWICRQFGENLDFDILVFHLLAPWDGVHSGMIDSAVRNCITVPLLITLAVFLATYVFSRKKYLKYYWRIATLLLAASLAYVYLTLGAHAYLFAKPTTFIEEHYVHAGQIDYTYPDRPKNLLFIFLESMESTYQNPQVFGDNLLPALSGLAAANASFQGYHKVHCTNWTFAALVSVLCGIPLKTEAASYAKAASLDDVLQPANYNLAALYGGKRHFAWTDDFLLAHGFHHIWAREDITAEYGRDVAINYWGVADAPLYRVARDKLTFLHGLARPFALFINTIDTHAPGYLDPGCPVKYNDMRDIMACADLMLGRFMEWAEQQPWYADTVIVLAGDHLAMKNKLYDKYLLIDGLKRDLVNVVINGPVPGIYQRNYAMFDMLPTVVEAMGIGLPGHCLGLGVSLYADQPTLLEQYGLPELDRQLQGRSHLYDSFNR